MALLGKFMDVVTGATFAAGSGGGGTAYQTVQHSLGTTPDVVIPIPFSVGVGTLPRPSPFWAGANASIATIGLAASTLAGVEALAFTTLCWSVHSIIR
jgi:hypothetical protein